MLPSTWKAALLAEASKYVALCFEEAVMSFLHSKLSPTKWGVCYKTIISTCT